MAASLAHAISGGDGADIGERDKPAVGPGDETVLADLNA
jgi:hypothetical protein